MVLVLGFPFELFLYSVFFFIAALVVHFAIHAATFQFAAATLIFLLVFVCLGLYWHVTEPQEKELLCSWVSQSRDVEAAIAVELSSMSQAS
ncbi:hypothetical protein EV401DRAFT_1503418 [Pisolithus croceorrhizus]|nr:hypothetical protein EV401DRAFT_1503418 [Pisolithus croceorrhizus]